MNMKRQTSWVLVATLFLCGTVVGLTSCQDRAAAPTPVLGTLEAPLPADSAPAHVLEAMERAVRFHQYEIMSDTANSITVEAIAEADTVATEGYGIVVTRGAASTTLPHLRHTRAPQARYDAETGRLWLAVSAMEGTGVSVERLCLLRFGADDKAYVSAVLDPYAVQQALCQRLTCSINGQQVTFFDDGRRLCTVTNSVTDMGGFDAEEPVWIGEQLGYDLSGDAPRLLVTPGVKLTTGLVLTYDDMPTLTADVTVDADGQWNVGELKLQASTEE